MNAEPYPEHARQQEILPETQAIGEFLDQAGYVLAEYREVDGFRDQQLVPVRKSIEQVLADYFGIDLDKIETEKRIMLARIAAVNSGSSSLTTG